MKSFLIWISLVAVGSVIGVGISFLTSMNMYLMIAIGVIIGSSIGITWNIHREREENFMEVNQQEENQSEEKNSPKKT